MKKYLFLLLLFTGCKGVDNATKEAASVTYEEANKRAEKQLLMDKNLAFGFQADMTQNAAKARVAQLDNTDESEVVLPLPSGVKLGVTSFIPEYAGDTLAELNVYFYRWQPADYTSLREMLADRYKQAGFAHQFIYMDEVSGDIVSWFNGPIEIQLVRTEFWLDVVYIDLRREQQYLREAAEKKERERQEMIKRYRENNALIKKP